MSYDLYPEASKNTFQATTFKVEENSRTFIEFQGKNEIQGLYKTVRTLPIETEAYNQGGAHDSNSA